MWLSKNKIRDQELSEKFTEFMKAALKLLRGEYGDFLPIIKRWEWKQLKSGGWTAELKEEFEFSQLIYENAESISNLMETQNLVEKLIRDKTTSKWCPQPRKADGKPYGEKEYSLYFIQQFLSKPLNRYLKMAKSYNFDKNTCAMVYSEFEEFLYRDFETFTIIAPLSGFDSNLDEIKLDKNLRIRKITHEERQRLLRQREHGATPVPRQDIFEIKFVITRVYTRKIGEAQNVFPSMDLFEKVVTALRLFKRGAVGFTNIYDTPDHWMSPFGQGTASRLVYKHIPFFKANYILNDSEVEDFLNFWKDFIEVELGKYRFLDLAINRFNLSLERYRRPEDRLIDIMIALEALYLREEMELSYKLATRAAFMLKNDSEERKRTVKVIKKAYSVRSKIVHGSKVKKEVKIDDKTLTLDKFVDEIEEHLRSSIQLFIELTKKYKEKQIFKLVDEVLFT